MSKVNLAIDRRACVYANNFAGGPGYKFVEAAKASLSSEAAVANSCGTDFRKYRLYIRLSSHERSKFRNMKVYVHGIAKSGGAPNSLLYNSGRFRIDGVAPSPTPSPRPFLDCNRRRGGFTACQ